jgi:hypothetical protein
VAHDELGQAVRNAHGQADALAGGRVAHGGRQLLAELEDLLGMRHRDDAGLREGDAPARRLEQRMPERALEQAHLFADRLHGHVQPRGGARHAALLGDHPEVIEVAVVERGGHADQAAAFARRRLRARRFRASTASEKAMAA